MASVTTPTINKIIRMNNFDLLGTPITQYNMYMCLDTLQLWYDETPSKRTLYFYIGVDTMNDLHNNLIPTYGKTYYCWESNSLWLWINKWVAIYTDNKYPSAYQNTEGTADSIYLDNQQPTIVDNNGLLRDGSVVIRDPNRIIKGRIYVGKDNDNLIFSSYLGGGIRFLPNGKMSTEGEFYIDDHSGSFIRAQFNVLNNEAYVDYTEHPEKDNNPYRTDKHRYLVYHEGNFKAEDFQLTSAAIYEKLVNPDTELPDPFEFNVKYLDGMEATDFAFKNHTHVASDISDFVKEAQANALSVMINYLTNAENKGVKVNWKADEKKFVLSADTFIISITGDATGQGTVTNLTNTTIPIEIDPDKHVHQNYIDRMDDLQDQIDALGTVDLSDYYNKQEVDDKFSTAPSPNKALLMDADGNLPRKCFNCK